MSSELSPHEDKPRHLIDSTLTYLQFLNEWSQWNHDWYEQFDPSFFYSPWQLQNMGHVSMVTLKKLQFKV